MREQQVPYLAPLSWYRAYVAERLRGDDTVPPEVAAGARPLPPNRGVIRGAWGEQTLTVPILGGRRKLAHTPYGELRLSEHGDWRHLHLQALTSAYGALPYFHYFEDDLRAIYAEPRERLQTVALMLHDLLIKHCDLSACLEYLKTHPTAPLGRPYAMPDHITALELLFARGREAVFSLI